MPRCLPYLAALSTAAFALLALVDCTAEVDARTGRSVPNRGASAVRVKGLRPHLVIHRKRGALIERMSAGQLAQPGDVLQISYVAAGHQHGVVVSVDGYGDVTLHHPASKVGSTRLHERGETPLSTAFELDDAPGFERFILVTTGDTPTDVDLVLSSARAMSRADAPRRTLPLPQNYHQVDLLVRKAP